MVRQIKKVILMGDSWTHVFWHCGRAPLWSQTAIGNGFPLASAVLQRTKYFDVTDISKPGNSNYNGLNDLQQCISDEHEYIIFYQTDPIRDYSDIIYHRHSVQGEILSREEQYNKVFESYHLKSWCSNNYLQQVKNKLKITYNTLAQLAIEHSIKKVIMIGGCSPLDVDLINQVNQQLGVNILHPFIPSVVNHLADIRDTRCPLEYKQSYFWFLNWVDFVDETWHSSMVDELYAGSVEQRRIMSHPSMERWCYDDGWHVTGNGILQVMAEVTHYILGNDTIL